VTGPIRTGYFVSKDASGSSDGVSDWPLPSADQSGDYLDAGGEYVRLHTLVGLLYDKSLHAGLYEAEWGHGETPLTHALMGYWRQAVESKSRAFRDFYLDIPQREVLARRVRLVRRIDTWRWSTARSFACDCAERALDAEMAQHVSDHGVMIDQAFQRRVVALARSVVTNDQEFETWLSQERDIDLDDGIEITVAHTTFCMLGGKKGISAEDMASSREEARALAKRELASSFYASGAAVACLELIPHYAANEAARLARRASGARSLFDERFLPDQPVARTFLEESLEAREERQERADTAWLSELRWQADHLSQLLGIDKPVG
jgi:hypothetical protein